MSASRPRIGHAPEPTTAETSDRRRFSREPWQTLMPTSYDVLWTWTSPAGSATILMRVAIPPPLDTAREMPYHRARSRVRASEREGPRLANAGRIFISCDGGNPIMKRML